jgi:hypothetical protein
MSIYIPLGRARVGPDKRNATAAGAEDRRLGRTWFEILGADWEMAKANIYIQIDYFMNVGF